MLFKEKGDVLMVFFCQIIFSDGRRSSKANPCQFVGWLSTWGGKEGKMGVLVLSSPELFQCIKAIKNLRNVMCSFAPFEYNPHRIHGTGLREWSTFYFRLYSIGK